MSIEESQGEEALYRFLFRMAMMGSAIIFFWDIWSLPILSLNEGRRMAVVREMLAGGNWLLPTLGEKAYITKPPLFYWVAGFFGLLFRSSAEWVVRLPSSVSAFLVAWLTYGWVKRYLGQWPALFSALVLITSYKFTLYARRAEIEMLLTLCCTLAAFFFFDYVKLPQVRWRLYLSYLFWGLAFLVKGPAALPFFLPPLFVFWFISKDRNILQGLKSWNGWAIFALVAFPWYIYTYLELGGGRWEVFWEKDILGKTFWSKGRDPFYSYPVEVILNFLPWIVIFFCQAKSYGRTVLSRHDMAFFGSWFLVPLALLSACATKHAKYILPLFPAAAALLGMWASNFFFDLRQRKGGKANRILLATVGILLSGWIVYYTLAEPYLVNYRFSTIKPMVQKIQQIKGDAPVFSYNHKYVRLIYYYQDRIPHLHRDKLNRLLKEHQSFLLIAEDRYWWELEETDLCPLAEYQPFLHRKKAARIYGSPDFCPGRDTSSLGKQRAGPLETKPN
jgi:4-amino-4-deoxy-L-arabinose transferase-like glycosyltransferase